MTRLEANMPTEGPDYRKREWVEQEVLAQIRIDGGLGLAWIECNKRRPAALRRLIQAGKVKHLPDLGSPWFQRYVICAEEPVKKKSALRNLLDRLGARMAA